jgi:sensor histidine kinase YesM
MQKLKDGWFIVFGITAFALMNSLVFFTEEWMINGFSFQYCFFISIIEITLFWMTNRMLIVLMRKWYPTVKHTTKRVLFQFLYTTIICVGLSVLLTYYFDMTRFWGASLSWKDYVYQATVMMFFVYIESIIYETTFYFSKWRQTVMETEQLKKSNLQSQLESLKNQVSPHFLFNSLNTLSSLIEEDAQQAIKFVNELSRVYRYLLQSNEKELSTLKDELDFLHAYYFLLKTRFSEGIQLQTNIDDTVMGYLIPPLTLQILVENAVKHNIVSQSRPLLIEIELTNDNRIIVKNNLQRKTLNVESNGMGLSNISAKFRLLNQPPIDIKDDDKEFTVTIPLLTN